jgi:hypothetical protein
VSENNVVLAVQAVPPTVARIPAAMSAGAGSSAFPLQAAIESNIANESKVVRDFTLMTEFGFRFMFAKVLCVSKNTKKLTKKAGHTRQPALNYNPVGITYLY